MLGNCQTVVQFSMHQRPGPGCSKLTTALVNVSLNLISEVNFTNMPIFFVEKNVRSFAVKLLSFFQHKISVYWAIKAVKHLTN